MKRILLFLWVGILPILPLWAQTMTINEQTASDIEILGILPLQTQSIRSLLVLENGLLLSGNYDGDKILWFDWVSQSETILWESSRHLAEHLSLNDEQTQVAFITNEEVQILDLVSGESEDFYIPREDEDVPIALAWGGTQIAIATVDGRILILDAASGELITEKVFEEVATHMIWRADGQLLSGHQDGTLALETNTWQGHSRRVTALATYGEWIASAGSDHHIRVWNSTDQSEILTFDATVGSLAFSPDGRLLVGGGASLHVWDLNTGEKLYERFHSNPRITAQHAAFHPLGNQIISGSVRVSIWGLSNNGLELEQLEDNRLAAGAELYQRNACYGCHFDYPSGAPTLYGLGELAGDRVEGLSAKDYIYQGIVDPDVYIPRGYPRGIHPQYYGERMSSEQVWLLVDYILSLEARR